MGIALSGSASVSYSDEGDAASDISSAVTLTIVGTAGQQISIEWYVLQQKLDANGIIWNGDDVTGVINGVEWNITESSTGTTYMFNNLGYIETLVKNDLPPYGYDEMVNTSSQGTNLVLTEGNYKNGIITGTLTGTLVIDISDTFAFNEADIRTLANIDMSYIGGTEADPNYFWAGGTATFNGEEVEVTFGVDATSVEGTTADDILNGTTGNDNISTLEGADVVYALAGNDRITLTADATWGSGYRATNVSNDSSFGTREKISIEGLNKFSDVIDGGDDVDTLILTTGNDAFFIDDVYAEHHSSLTLSTFTQGIYSTARVIDLETINAGEGNDIVDLTSWNFVLTDAVTINGEAGDDNLWGSNGDDTIDGGAGNDSIFGGSGSDTLTGGFGADVFQFTATSASDVITDLDFRDTIQLYYRAEDEHTNDDLSLSNGVLTWSTSVSNDVLIDFSATTTSSDLNDVDSLITFVEIV